MPGQSICRAQSLPVNILSFKKPKQLKSCSGGFPPMHSSRRSQVRRSHGTLQPWLEWCTVAKPLDPWICSVQQTAAVKKLYRLCYGFHLDCCCRKPVLLPRLSPSTAAEPCRGAAVQCRAVCTAQRDASVESLTADHAVLIPALLLPRAATIGGTPLWRQA